METFEINGVKYQRKPEIKPKQYSRTMSKVLAMSMMASAMCPDMGYGMGYGGNEPERPNVDIIKEYELIQQKKSMLSKSNRDWVERCFENNFIKVEE